LDHYTPTNARTSQVPSRTRVGFGCLIVVLGIVFSSGTVKAYRPFDGTDGDVADVGEFELELGPLQFQQAGDEKLFSTPTVLNLGVIPRMELVADFVPLYPQDGGPTQVTDTDVFAKFLLRKGVLQDESGPSLAIEAGPLVPEYNGERGFGASANLIVSERFGWLTLHLNNEAELSRRDLNFGWATSLIGEANLGPPVRPVAELSIETDLSSGSKTYSALAGAIWNVVEDLDLDAAGRIASIDGERAFEVRLGLTWAVSVWTPGSEHNEHERTAGSAHKIASTSP
jgi:hypothetical protein